MQRACAELARLAESCTRGIGLTAAEERVASRATAELSTKEIAAELFVAAKEGPIRTDMWADVLDGHDRMADHLSEEHRRLDAPAHRRDSEVVRKYAKTRGRSRARHGGTGGGNHIKVRTWDGMDRSAIFRFTHRRLWRLGRRETDCRQLVFIDRLPELLH